MAYVKTVDESEAHGETAEVYARVKAPDGRVANVLKLESLLPRSLAAHHAFYREIMFGAGPLGRPQRELIAVAVSQANDCHY